MKKEYYLTGEVSKMFNISLDTIRYYNKLGLIDPPRIDENNYRYFALHQVSNLSSIKVLRSLGIPIKKIHEYMESKDIYIIKNYLEEIMTNIDNNINNLQKTKINLSRFASKIENLSNINSSTEVIVRKSPKLWVVRSSNELDIQDLVKHFCEAGTEFDVCSYAFFINKGHFVNNDFTHSKFGLIYESPCKSDNEEIEFLPNRLCAYSTYMGELKHLGKTYTKMLNWINDNNFTVEDDIIEKFILSNKTCYLFELWIPIKVNKV